MLGKRQRTHMKRTASMSEFSLDLSQNNGEAQPSDHLNEPFKKGADQRLLPPANVSPRFNHRHNSADHIETAPFLKACFLCKRRLVPGRDIYIYRGDSAFCSLECRQQQMNQEERKEKCSLASKKEVASTTSTIVLPQVSTKGETVAAV